MMAINLGLVTLATKGINNAKTLILHARSEGDGATNKLARPKHALYTLRLR